MKTRAILALTAVAGLAAAANAQENIGYSWSFVEVTAGGNVPVTNPNGMVDPGEAARLELTATITPGIGSPVTYTPPPAPGNGTIAGLGSIFFDLGASANAGAGGWSFISRLSGWALGGAGTAVGNNVNAAQAGQFVLPGSTANAANPVVSIWRGVWNPNGDYAARTVTFTSAGAVAAGTAHSSIIVKYGNDPETGDPLYVGKFVGGNFGQIQVPVNIPAPASLALVGLGGLVATRRRR